jgi:Tfp pilus assembly protein PilF
VQATLALGSHYLQRGQHKLALERFLAAAQMAPGYEMPFAHAAHTLRKLGALKEAAEFERLAQSMAATVSSAPR